MSGLEFMDLTRLIPRGACVYAVGFLLTDEELLALAVYRRVEQWELEAGGPPFALDQYFRKTKQNLSIVWTDRYRYRDRQEGGRVKDFNVLVVKTDVVWDDEPEPRLNKAVFKEHHFEILFPKNFIQTEGKGTGTKFTFEDMRHRLVCMPWPDYQCMPHYVFTMIRQEAEKRKVRLEQSHSAALAATSSSIDETLKHLSIA